MKRWILPLCTLLVILPISRLFAQENLNGVQLDGTLSGMSDVENIAGFLPGATDLYDSGIDLPEPPSPPGSCLIVTFGGMSDAPAWFGGFCQDWRDENFDPTTDAAVFPIDVYTFGLSGTVELNFTLGGELPAQTPVTLYNEGTYQDLRSNNIVSFHSSTARARDLVLIIGTPPEPTIHFQNPSDNPLFISGNEEELNWMVLGEVAIEETVVDISLDNGENWTNLLEAGDLIEEASWTIPAQATESGQLRVEVLDHLDRRSSSVATFRIQDQTEWLSGVEILSPTATMPLVAGETVQVSWSYEGGDENVTGALVEYRIHDAPYQTINEVTGTGTSTNWLVPTDCFSSNATVRVTAEVSEGESYSGIVEAVTLWPTELLNDNFEVWTDHGAEVGPPNQWEAVGEGYGSSFQVTRSGENAVEGFYSARMQAQEACSFSLVQEIANPIEGTQVLMRISLLDNTAGITGRIVLTALDELGEQLLAVTSDGTANDAEFQTLAVNLTVPASAAALRIEIEAIATEASYLLADLVRLEMSSPNPDITFSSPVSGDLFTYDGEATFEVVWSYGATAPFVASAALDVSVDDGESWQELATFAGATTTQYLWGGEDAYSLRTRFRVHATNDEGVEGSGISEAMVLRPSASDVTLEGNWHLVSVPLEAPEMTVASVFQDDLPSAIVYRYQSTLDPIYIQATNLEMGEGYWLGTDQDATFAVNGTAEIDQLERSLDNGWNLIGSGYPVPVAVSTLQLANDTDTLSFAEAVSAGWVASVLYGSPDGTGFYSETDESGALDVWAGYWLGLLDGERRIIIPAPLPDQVPQGPVQQHGLDELDEEGEFVAEVRLLADGQVRGRITLGHHVDASMGYDPQLDQPAPPSGPVQGQPRLTILFDEAELPTGQELVKEIHGCLDTDQPRDEWTFHSEPGNATVLSLDLTEVMEALPQGYEARLHVEQNSYDLHLSTLIDLAGDEEDIRLEIWSPDLSNASEPDQFPSAFSVNRIWPNPFNAAVQIEVDLPASHPVNVQLFDITGRLVGTWKRELEAGRRTLNLKPSVSSGVYLVRIALPGGESRSGKIVVLK